MSQATAREHLPSVESRAGLTPRRATLSRVVQLVLAIVGLVLLAPLFLLVALAVRLTSSGPIFYRGQRVGKDERIFTIYKFRTLAVGAEKQIGARLLKEEDPVYTPVGKLLKKTKLDELPQLLNVLKGDMNLVGPRPIRPIFLERLKQEIPDYALRFQARPGMTGLAQVRGGYWTDPRDKLRYELVYIKNQSLWLDLKVIVLTLLKIFSRFVTTGAILSALFLLVSFFPSSLYPWLYTTMWGVKLNLLHLLIIGCGLLLVAKKTYTHRLYVYRSPIYLPMLGFTVIGLVAALFSPAPETAARGTVYYLVTGFMITLGFLNTKVSSGFARSTATLVGLACGALSLLGLLELALLQHTVLADGFIAAASSPLAGTARVWAIKATFANANALSAYLVLGFPLLLCQLVHARTRNGRDFWLVSTTIAFTSILLTQNFLGLVALFVACAIFLAFTSSRTVPLLVCVFLMPVLLFSVWDESTFLIKTFQVLQVHVSKEIGTLMTTPSQLLLGSGLKTLQAALEPSAALQSTAELTFGNMHLTLIKETGLVGWFLMLWIFWTTLRILYQAAHQTMDPYQRSLLWAIFASVVGFLISLNGIDAFLHLPLQILFWGLIGLGLSVTTHIVNKHSPFYVIWRFGDDRPPATQPLPAAAQSPSRPFSADADVGFAFPSRARN